LNKQTHKQTDVDKPLTLTCESSGRLTVLEARLALSPDWRTGEMGSECPFCLFSFLSLLPPPSLPLPSLPTKRHLPSASSRRSLFPPPSLFLFPSRTKKRPFILFYGLQRSPFLPQETPHLTPSFCRSPRPYENNLTFPPPPLPLSLFKKTQQQSLVSRKDKPKPSPAATPASALFSIGHLSVQGRLPVFYSYPSFFGLLP